MAAARLLLGYVLLVVTAIGWAGAWLTARAAAHDAPPLTVTVGRFLVAAAALLPVWLILAGKGRVRPSAKEWGFLVGMSLTGIILYTLLFLTGIALAPASDGAVLTPGLAGVSAMLLGAALARTAPAPRALAGAALSVTGCALVGWAAFSKSEADPGRLVGDALFVAAALTWGVYTVLGKRIADRVPAVTSILLVSSIGAALLLPVALAVDGVPDVGGWSDAAILNVLYLGLVATAVAFVTFYLAVRMVGLERTAPALGLVPVFGVLGAHFVLGEELTPLHAAGAALVLSGIAVTNLPRRNLPKGAPGTTARAPAETAAVAPREP